MAELFGYCQVNYTHEVDVTVENRLRELRLEHEMTQQSLATRVGVTRQTILAIEGGGYVPSVRLALLLAEALARPVEEIFWLPDEKRRRS
jgi:putative transcriptional regulator